jgi:alpha-1,3-rhamnosyl/mannosyltransferase
MRIAIDLMKPSGFSGNHSYTLRLLEALVAEFPSDEYWIYTYLGKRGATRRFVGGGVRARCWGVMVRDRMFGALGRGLLEAWNRRIQRTVSAACDIHHATNPMRYPGGLPHAVVTIHDLAPLRDAPWVAPEVQLFFRERIGEIVDDARVVLTNSQWTRDDVVDRFPHVAHKVVATPLAAGSEFRPRPAEPDVLARHGIADAGRPFLLYVGALQPRKNILAVLDAFGALPPSVQRGLDLVLVGTPPTTDYRAEIEGRLESMPARDRVHRLERVSNDDLITLYSSALGLVYVSLFEGFGLPVAEAMACGCPVVTSRSTVLEEVAGGAALLVDPHDTDEIRDAIVRLVEDDELKTDLRERGLARSEQLTWRRTAELTMEAYRRVSG